MNQKNQSKQKSLFKDSFTLKQYSSFSLIFNWILPDDKASNTQYHILRKTEHFRKFSQSVNLKSSKIDEFKKIIIEFRNYFSHYKSAWPSGKLESIKKELEDLMKESIFTLENRGTKLSRNIASLQLDNQSETDINKEKESEKEIKKMLDRMKENPLEYFSVDEKQNIQPTLALLVSLFLTRSQMSFLVGKIFVGRGINRQSCSKYQAISKILETLSQNDRVISKSNMDQGESLLSSKEEMAYAIWGRLETAGLYKKEVKGSFPEDLWFIKQLILFLEYKEILPSVEFARVNTKEKDDQLEQEIVFDSQYRDKPLRIRYNTVEVEIKLSENSAYKTNFGIRTLKYLVWAYLKNTKSKNNLNCSSVDSFIVKWFQNSNHQFRSSAEKKNRGISKERVMKRIKYLICKYKSWIKTEPKLFDQIRFICQFINVAWNQVHNQYMNQHQFEEWQGQIRHYRSNEIKSKLIKDNLHNVTGIGLGKTNFKKLSSCMVKNQIQFVFKDILNAHLEWLRGQLQNIDNHSFEQLNEIANFCQLRNQKETFVGDSLSPVSMNFKSVIEEFSEQDKLKKFEERVQELCQGKLPALSIFDVNAVDTEKSERRKKRIKQEKQIRTGLLICMIRSLLEADDQDSSKKKIKKGDQLLSGQEIEKDLENGIKIKYKFKQSQRLYAKYNKEQLCKLIKTYKGSNFKGELSLLDDNASKDNSDKKHKASDKKSPEEKLNSIQALRRKADRERFIFMQALLEWEKVVANKNNLKPQAGKNYIGFKKILEVSSLSKSEGEELSELRNACMHNDIGKMRFSEVPNQEIKKLYKDIEKKDRDKRKSQKKTAVKENNSRKNSTNNFKKIII